MLPRPLMARVAHAGGEAHVRADRGSPSDAAGLDVVPPEDAVGNTTLVYITWPTVRLVALHVISLQVAEPIGDLRWGLPCACLKPVGARGHSAGKRDAWAGAEAGAGSARGHSTSFYAKSSTRNGSQMAEERPEGLR